MNRHLRHDLWGSAVLVVVAGSIGGLVYHSRIRNDDLSQYNSEVLNSPDGLQKARDRAKAAKSVPLANATPPKPLILAAPVSIKPNNQPAVVPLATAGKNEDDDMPPRPTAITSLGPAPSPTAHVTQSALAVRKAAAAVPLAGAGNVAPVKLSIPLVTVNSGSTVSLPPPVLVLDVRTERETPNPVTINSGARTFIPVVEVAARDDDPHAAVRTAARSVALAGVSVSINEPATQLLPTTVVTIPNQPTTASSVAPVSLSVSEQAPAEIARPSQLTSRASSLSALAPVSINSVEVPEIIHMEVPVKRSGVSVDPITVTMPAETMANLPITTPAKPVRPKLDIAPVSLTAVENTSSLMPITVGNGSARTTGPDIIHADAAPKQAVAAIDLATVAMPAEPPARLTTITPTEPVRSKLNITPISLSAAANAASLMPVTIGNAAHAVVPDIIHADTASKQARASVDLAVVQTPVEPAIIMLATTSTKPAAPKIALATVIATPNVSPAAALAEVTDIRCGAGIIEPISLGTVRSPDSFKLDTEPISASRLEHGTKSVNILAPAEIGPGQMTALPEPAAIHVFPGLELPGPVLPGKPTPNVSGAAAISLATVTDADSRLKTNELATATVKTLTRGELSLAVLETNQAYVYLVTWLPLPKIPEVVWDTDRTPADPLASIQSFTKTEPALVEWIKKWKEDIYAELRTQDSGPKTQAAQLSTLEDLLSQTSLSCTQLYEIGHAIKYVEGMAGAAPFYRAAVGKAELELKGHTPGNTNDLSVIHALAHMGVWFPIQDRVYPTLARIFRLIRENTPVDNGLYLRSSMLLATSLYEVGRGPDNSANLKAAEIFRAMLQHPEVQKWPRVNQDSLHLGLAYALFQGERYAEAAPEFEMFLASGNLGDAKAAWQIYIMTLAYAGRVAEAKLAYGDWISRETPDKRVAERIAQRLARY